MALLLFCEGLIVEGRLATIARVARKTSDILPIARIFTLYFDVRLVIPSVYIAVKPGLIVKDPFVRDWLIAGLELWWIKSILSRTWQQEASKV
jgi:hypothetical protein